MIAVPADYTSARQRFRETAEQLRWTWQPYKIGVAGPDGGDLTIDVATSPDTETDRVLVLSSGLHGVEGPLGSAMQTALMERWHRTPGAGRARAVLIHALNPYGFAWTRRADADNIDLNRNFASEPLPSAEGLEVYRQFDPLLNPRHPPKWDAFHLRALAAIAIHGKGPLAAALVAGQCEFPKGLFFGGSGPSQTRAIVERHMRSWIGHAKTIVHLDIHTGLGSWGTRKLLIDYPLSPDQRDRLTRWFGSGAFHEAKPERVMYRARGSFGPWCVSGGFAPDYMFAFVEFGTYRDLAVLAGLRAENQAHHWGTPGDARTVRARARLRELFCPASPDWRERALTAGLEVVERALNGLTEEAGTR